MTGARGVGELLSHHYGSFVTGLAALFVSAAVTILLAVIFSIAGHVQIV